MGELQKEIEKHINDTYALDSILKIVEEMRREFLKDFEILPSTKKYGLWKVKTDHKHPSYKLAEWWKKWLGNEQQK